MLNLLNMAFQQFNEPKQLLMETLTLMQRILVIGRPSFFTKALDEQSCICAHSFPVLFQLLLGKETFNHLEDAQVPL